MLKIKKGVTDNHKAFGALLTDLSKAFDCLSNDLLIAKLRAYSLDIDSLNLLRDYLSNREQRTKVDSFYTSWEAILSGVPQGSVLGPLLLKATYFTGYADDKTPFVVRDNTADVTKDLEEIGEELLNWFLNNEMKLNTNKCPLLLNSQGRNTLKISDLNIITL